MKVLLYAPAEYWETPKEMVDKVVGGCGPGGFGDYLVPDTIYGIRIREACRIHDFYYSAFMPGTYECKFEADRVFLNNMIRIIKVGTKNRVLRLLMMNRAKEYYLAVKYFGGGAFWKNKNDPENMREVEI